jgi:hypothetical protein
MATLGVKMIEYDLPNVSAHIRNSKAVATSLAEMINGGDERVSIAPRSAGQGPLLFAIRQEIHSGYVEATFAFREIISPPVSGAILPPASARILPFGFGG